MAAQSAELQNRLVDVESTALRHGKKIIAKLEERVRGLEDELGEPIQFFPLQSVLFFQRECV